MHLCNDKEGNNLILSIQSDDKNMLVGIQDDTDRRIGRKFYPRDVLGIYFNLDIQKIAGICGECI